MKIVAVVVLYQQTAAQSATVQTLHEALSAARDVDCSVLVYDNTPVAPGTDIHTNAAGLPDGFRYQRAAQNRGLLGGYAAALRLAQDERCEWLLTLDQDTALPRHLFQALQRPLAAAAAHPRIAAIVPHLEEGNRALSPAYAGIGRARPLPRGFSGIPPREARAFNSAALLRVAALEQIGGFHPCFWLDYLDNWLHHELYRQGWQMYVAGDLHIQHQLSILNYRERLSAAHYGNFLSAEGAFHDLSAPPWTRAAYAAQLSIRLLNQYRRRELPEIRRLTREAIAMRLRSRRAARLEQWRTQAGCTEQREQP